MTDLPVAGYISTDPRSIAEQKAALEAIRDVIAELPGGSAEIELTLNASGTITPTGAIHSVDTYGDASADDLENIITTNIPDGRFLLLHSADDARVVTVKHEAGGAGQISLIFGNDIVLKNTKKFLLLQRSGSDMIEIMLDRSKMSICKAYRATSNQSINSGAFTTIQFNEIDFDRQSEFNISSNFRFEPLEAGLYQVSLHAAIESLADGAYVQVLIYKGAAADAIYSPKMYNHTGGATDIRAEANGCIKVTTPSSDYLRGSVYHNHGSARDLAFGISKTFFDIRKIG